MRNEPIWGLRSNDNPDHVQTSDVTKNHPTSKHFSRPTENVSKEGQIALRKSCVMRVIASGTLAG